MLYIIHKKLYTINPTLNIYRYLNILNDDFCIKISVENLLLANFNQCFKDTGEGIKNRQQKNLSVLYFCMMFDALSK